MIAAALSVVALAAAPVTTDARPVGVKVTHGHLRPLCLDGEPTKSGERSWRLPAGQHSMAFTMFRDRTVDRIVSGEPDWNESEACKP